MTVAEGDGVGVKVTMGAAVEGKIGGRVGGGAVGGRAGVGVGARSAALLVVAVVVAAGDGLSLPSEWAAGFSHTNCLFTCG